uniref:Uncharacterized protein n=1 Tax=Heterorhabditis bacteriophora TaxID=37862 RepID=A0A1I7WH51_HETBA
MKIKFSLFSIIVINSMLSVNIFKSLVISSSFFLNYYPFLKPPTQWDKWPYLRSRLDMLDGTVKFWPSPLLHGHDQLIDRVGGRIIYYNLTVVPLFIRKYSRDNGEEAKQLCEEERKQIKIKENGQQPGSAITRRKERPLRIQMSSISEP